MFRSTSTGFNKYDVSEKTAQTARQWDDSHMYKSTYFQMSEKNPLALKNSTEQLLKTKSKNLSSITSRGEFSERPVDNTNFINHDYNNLFRTSYGDMSHKLPKLVNTHYVPGYKGFVPGMTSENPFASNITRLSKEKILDFDKRRFSCENINYRDWQYNPLSKTHGNFWKKNLAISTKKTLVNHGYTGKLRDSGYSTNHFTCDRTGWIPHENLDGDMKRTEYRIQYNTKKEIHYKGPMYSTGKLKMREQNYKHT